MTEKLKPCPNSNGCGYCAEHGCPRAADALAPISDDVVMTLRWYANLPKEWVIKTENGLSYGDLHLLGEKARAALNAIGGKHD